MSNGKKLEMTAGFDRGLIYYRGDSVRYLAVEVSAPALAPSKGRKIPALNLGIVIDASGSMSGPPLDAAKRAAAGIVDSLKDGDHLSVVSFGSDVHVHLDGVTLSADTRESAKREIQTIETRGCTNLSGGWLEGAECVSKVQNGHPKCVNRVLVLTDGYANQGITDPSALANISAGLFKRGVITSTVGIGNNYSSSQIQSMAEHGGGLVHDAERPEEIVEVVLGEFKEIMGMFAESVEFVAECPSGVKVRPVGRLAFSGEGGRFVCGLGALVAGRSRTTVFQVTCPSGVPGAALKFAVSLRWKKPGEPEAVCTDPVELELRHAISSENSSQPRDIDLSLKAAAQWQAAVVENALHYNESGQFERARGYIEDQKRYFARYCHGLPGGEGLTAELVGSVTALSRPMDNRMRKDVWTSVHHNLRGTTDHRSTARPDWKENLLAGSTKTTRGGRT